MKDIKRSLFHEPNFLPITIIALSHVHFICDLEVLIQPILYNLRRSHQHSLAFICKS